MEDLVPKEYIKSSCIVFPTSNSFPFNEDFEWPWNVESFKGRGYITKERAVAFNLLQYGTFHTDILGRFISEKYLVKKIISLLRTIRPTDDIVEMLTKYGDKHIDEFVCSLN